jgi:Putative Ig domain
MRPQFKILMVTAALITAGLSAAVPAAAATAPPVMDTSVFGCSNGVCEVGPGNVGTPFAAGLNVGSSNNPPVERYYGDCFTMKIISGSLPPGLQLSLPSSEWIVTGTPTRAGTYPFTVQFTQTEVSSFCGPGDGPPGTQQLSITIGTGSSDRLVATSALYQGHQFRLYVDGFDVNISAQYSVYKTSTGQLVIPAQANTSTWNDGILTLSAHVNDPCGTLNSCNITLTDSLGSSVTLTLPPAKY